MIFVLFENGKYPFVFAGTKRGRQIRNKLYFCKTARRPPDFFEPVKIRKTGLVFLPVSAKLFKTAEICGCLAGYCPIAGICFFCGIFALLFLHICIRENARTGGFCGCGNLCGRVLAAENIPSWLQKVFNDE